MSREYYELKKLAEKMDKMDQFVQTLSKYCLTNFILMERRFWDQMAKWRHKTAIKMAELEDEIEELKEHKEEQELKIRALQAKSYAKNILPSPNNQRKIVLTNGHIYGGDEFEAFLRHGSSHCSAFYILNGRRNEMKGFVGYPAMFFNDLIKYAHETTFPAGIIDNILICLSSAVEPAPWPDLNNLEVQQKRLDFKRNAVAYEFGNKNQTEIIFCINIWFKEAKNFGIEMCEFFLHKRIKS